MVHSEIKACFIKYWKRRVWSSHSAIFTTTSHIGKPKLLLTQRLLAGGKKEDLLRRVR